MAMDKFTFTENVWIWFYRHKIKLLFWKLKRLFIIQTTLKYPFNDRNCNNCGNKDCFSKKGSPETYHTSPPCTGWIRI